jgi:hypothetical protein
VLPWRTNESSLEWKLWSISICAHGWWFVKNSGFWKWIT